MEEIRQIQSDLLHLGAWLATTPGSPSMADLMEITGEHCKALELAIDRMVESMPALKSFILPGGHISAAWAHVARTVCRRAERRVVRLYEESIVGDGRGELWGVLTYLNRLSDYLFVLGRHCNMHHGVRDIEWEKK
jgi:cob(I)alamin adenosyltransferase